MDPHVRTSRDLALPDNALILGSIPVIKNKRDRRRRAIVFSSFAAAYCLAAFVAIAAILSSLHR
jgi:hypothetical protein